MTISNQDARSLLITHNGVQPTYNYTFQEPDPDNIAVYSKHPSIGGEVKLTNPTDFTVAVDSDSIGGTVTLTDPTAFISGTVMRIVRETPRVQATRITGTGGAYLNSIEAALDELTRITQELTDQVNRSVYAPHTDAAVASAGSRRISDVLEPVNPNDAATLAYAQSLLGLGSVDLSIYSGGLLTLTNRIGWLDALGFSDLWRSVMGNTSLAASLLALGFGNDVRLFLLETTTDAMMNRIGITSAFMRGMMNDLNAAEARNSLGISGLLPAVNDLVNPDFRVWQTGTAFSAPNDNTYTADQWKILAGASGAVDVDKGGVTTNAGRGSMQITQVIADTRWGVCQILESEKSKAYASKPGSFAVTIRAQQTVQDFKLLVAEWQGTADTITTSDPISSWGALTGLPTLGADWVWVPGAELDCSVVGSGWETFELENVTMPAGCENLAVILISNAPSMPISDLVEVSEFVASQAVNAPTFFPRTKIEEVRECQRFYLKTFPLDVTPAEGVGSLDGSLSQLNRDTAGGRYLNREWRFPVEMLKPPGITPFNPMAAGTAWRAGASTATKPWVAPTGISKSQAALTSDSSSGTVDVYHIHAVADARL